MLKSIVDVPLAEASEPAIGGFSWAGDSVAVNRVVEVPAVVEDEGVELLEQPAARRMPIATMERRFMCSVTPFVIRRIYGSG
jgi:hypothetical protein